MTVSHKKKTLEFSFYFKDYDFKCVAKATLDIEADEFKLATETTGAFDEGDEGARKELSNFIHDAQRACREELRQQRQQAYGAGAGEQIDMFRPKQKDPVRELATFMRENNVTITTNIPTA